MIKAIVTLLMAFSAAASAQQVCNGETQLEKLTCELVVLIESQEEVVAEVKSIECEGDTFGIVCDASINYIDLGSQGEPPTVVRCEQVISYQDGDNDYEEISSDCD